MNDSILLITALLAGMVLGALFFGGLWWTVRRGLVSSWPALWFVSSLLLRLGMVLAGFYVVGGAGWRRMVACLLGRAPTHTDTELQLAEEPHHAP